MYKLREARLKELYTSGEILRDVQRSNSSPGLREERTKAQWSKTEPTHADSLVDHSFLSLKTKEIRDSESPTRDVSYHGELFHISFMTLLSYNLQNILRTVQSTLIITKINISFPYSYWKSQYRKLHNNNQ